MRPFDYAQGDGATRLITIDLTTTLKVTHLKRNSHLERVILSVVEES